MPNAKLKEASAKAFAEHQVCATLHKEYGEAIKAVAAAKVALRAGKATATDVKSKEALGRLALADLNKEIVRLEKAIDALDKAIQAVPLNGPDAKQAQDAGDDLKIYRNGLVIYKRAEEYYKREILSKVK